jgi:hypothetical protein
MQHRRLWPLVGVAIAGSTLLVLGGLASGHELGQMVAGYSLLALLSGIYLAVGLAIRDRVWQRLASNRSVARPLPVDLHSRRVF